MAAKTSVLDKFVQRVTGIMYIPAAHGTGEDPSVQIATNWNPKDMLGCLIQRVKYTIMDMTTMDAIGDVCRVGLSVTGAQPAGGWEFNSPGVIDCVRFGPSYGTLVGFRGGSPEQLSVSTDFTNLQGGGLLAHPASLYIWNFNQSAADWAALLTCHVEIYYTLVDLTPAEWQEMWQLGFINQTL